MVHINTCSKNNNARLALWIIAVRLVDDGYFYPPVTEMIQVTITP